MGYKIGNEFQVTLIYLITKFLEALVSMIMLVRCPRQM